jgi:hypothetical protein
LPKYFSKTTKLIKHLIITLVRRGNKMSDDKSTWAIGGGVMLGIGVGFFFLPNALAFVGSIMAGLGLGLIATSIISKK